MSTREHLIRTLADALKAVGIPDHDDMAGEVLDSILPQITDTKQLLGVPEHSVLVDREGMPLRIQEGFLVNACTSIRVGRGYLEHFGPVTVVWMP